MRKSVYRTQRVSQYYKLGADQTALEFLDVDVEADTRLYLDPRAIRHLAATDDWAADCVELLCDYFERLLKAVKDGDRPTGIQLLKGLGEPNDTRLGMSSEKARGNAIGKKLRAQIWEKLSESEAAQSGLIEDLEDTALMIDLIGTDRISDITTNVIRGPLVAFTQDMCDEHSKISTELVSAGLIWDPDSHSWVTHQREQLPIPRGRPLLLVPKAIVRARLDFDPGDYYQHAIGWLQDWELTQPGGDLVELLKNGRHRVTKKNVVKKYRRRYGKTQKQLNTRATLEHVEILESYKRKKLSPLRRPSAPTYAELAEATGAEPPNLRKLLAEVKAVRSGKAGAARYHEAIAALFDVLFWPELQFGETEVKTHRGRKRLDIRYVNTREGSGFFSWLASNYGDAPHIVCECKNYSEDPANPELDQLLGRFTRQTGKAGILACRTFKDKDAFIERCNESAKGGQGHVLPLEDSDLEELVDARLAKDNAKFNGVLFERFHEIID